MAGGISASARAPAELSPVVHEVPALLEKVTTSIGGLDRVADSVGKGLLNDVVRVGLSRDNLDENGGGNQSLKRRPVAKS